MIPAITRGHFELSSGLHTDTYVQCSKYLQDPSLMESEAKKLAAKWKGRVDAVASPAVGGVVIGYEVAKALSVPFIFTEREDGVMTLRRGFTVGEDDNVLIVEDVVTTGASAKEVADAIEACDATPIGLMCLVTRYDSVPDFGQVISLHKAAAPVWDKEHCPLCADGVILEKPGSRNLA